MTDGIDRLLSPRSIAFVGASPTLERAPMRVLANLRASGYSGAVYPVNPRYDEAFGFRCYPALDALPEVPDVVALAVGGGRMMATLEEAAALGVPSALVYAAAFNESGADAHALEQQLREFCDRTGMRVLGPSTQGSFRTVTGACLSWSAAFSGADFSRSGPIGWVSQSGAVGTAALDLFRAAGVGLSHWISTGNEVDLEFSEVARRVLNDERTAAICGYVETIRDVPGFRAMAEEARRLGKPVVLIKGGTSDAGSAAAASHTGALASSAGLFSAFFRQCGVIMADDLDQLVTIAWLAAEKPGLGRRGSVAVMSNSGGLGIVLADICDRAGLSVTPLSDEARDAIAPILPDFVAAGNPVDMPVVAMRRPDDVESMIAALHREHEFDAYFLALLGIRESAGYDLDATLAAIRRADDLTGGRVIPLLIAGADDLIERGAVAGLAITLDAPRVIRGVGMLTRGAEQARPPRPDLPSEAHVGHDADASHLPSAGDDGRSAHQAPPARDLSEAEAKRRLVDAGFSVPTSEVAVDADAAVAAAQRIDGPVVMKVASPDIVHKSDVGGVKVGLSSEQDVREAWAAIMESVARLAPQSRVDGCLVEALAAPGVDVVVGFHRDPVLGAAIMFGAGGIDVELYGDVAFRVLPIDDEDARSMIAETRVARLLDGWRGAPPADIEALVELLLRTAEWITAQGDSLADFEMNPVRVHEHGVTILDAVMSLTE